MDRTQEEEYLAVVRKMVNETGYGTVSIVIQDHRIIQIDKTEKIRLGGKPDQSSG